MKDYNDIKPLSKKKEYFIIVLFWIIYALLYFLKVRLSNGSNPPKLILVNTELFGITFFCTEIITFCIIYFIILPQLFDIKNWRKVLILLISSFCTFILSRYFIEQILTNICFGIINYHEKTPILAYAFDNIFYGSKIIILTYLVWIIIHFIKTLQQKNKFEKEKNEAEIKFLKAQINPHFLFNTMNNIYSLVSINSDKSLKAIENLSAIMRFTTYETSKDLISLQTEIDYINQYLDLEQIRYGELFFVEKSFKINDNSIFIHPYILSPLIENAIKHGIVKDKNHPIKINITSTTNYLEIAVENKINQQQKDETTGIGLSNLKKRLIYYYEKNYTFEINNNYDTFNVYLKIPLDVKN